MKKVFAWVELLILLAIIGILTALILPGVQKIRADALKAREAKQGGPQSPKPSDPKPPSNPNWWEEQGK